MAIVKVMISLPKDFLKEIDRIARKEKRSRSELFREAARLYVQVRQARTVHWQNPAVQRAIAIQDAIAREDRVTWDAVAEVRKWRERW
jgi:metal-responsive CopG/Arc/MetJ family transcriptional regulator